MIKLEQTHTAPIVIWLMRPNNQRTHRNFMVGETITIENHEVSPELKQLERHGCVRMTLVEDTSVAEVAPIDEMDFETLEKELLK